MIRLVPAEPEDYLRLGLRGLTRDGWRAPEGGIASLRVLEGLAEARRGLGAAGGAYLIVDGRTVAGLCGLKAPAEDGTGEIGYGIAAPCRGRGIATAAVRLLLGECEAALGLRLVRAETAADNDRSIRVLRQNGFEAAGGGAPDGRLRWQRRLAPAS